MNVVCSRCVALLLALCALGLVAATLIGAAPAGAGSPAALPPGPHATSSESQVLLPGPGVAALGPQALLAVQQAELLAPDGDGADFFGGAVAISGDTALVGASSDSVGTN
jgi:hypothetical protein